MSVHPLTETPVPSSVEALQERIERLVVERQRLRGERADREVLEANRDEIRSAQRALAGALLARYLPAPAAAAA